VRVRVCKRTHACMQMRTRTLLSLHPVARAYSVADSGSLHSTPDCITTIQGSFDKIQGSLHPCRHRVCAFVCVCVYVCACVCLRAINPWWRLLHLRPRQCLRRQMCVGCKKVLMNSNAWDRVCGVHILHTRTFLCMSVSTYMYLHEEEAKGMVSCVFSPTLHSILHIFSHPTWYLAYVLLLWYREYIHPYYMSIFTHPP